jgi:hypothetical protein
LAGFPWILLSVRQLWDVMYASQVKSHENVERNTN